MVILSTCLGLTLTKRNTELSLVGGWKEADTDLPRGVVLL